MMERTESYFHAKFITEMLPTLILLPCRLFELHAQASQLPLIFSNTVPKSTKTMYCGLLVYLVKCFSFLVKEYSTHVDSVYLT